MKILVIPEDFRKDQYTIKPIITAMMAKLGKPRTKVMVCQDPLLGGVSEALKWENIENTINQYPMVDLFLLCVDRDGKEGRKTSLEKLEARAAKILSERRLLLAENAWQEIEVWVLAGQDLPKDWNWQDVRSEINPKETYFLPLSQQRNLLNAPGEGRKKLAEEAARRYERIRQLCPEDLVNLENRINAYIAG
ncbi:MAG: hypothetical protein HC849_04045 [Oscillatoriales cyanobacterium RU_3_3]|nr:hypothetical protein [Microcoleus sp. SU_5_3]NJL68085.1 hypothetical protein [Microcoleus sp. SM1_3_4]NJM59541.1 hypothetical protein [Oscillatoriales cyanobacterium RU_3_3]NJP22588.1 hypothetical protein [Hydrococcus sp. CRU_1_1]NJR26685.1 hypothetical protein [Richelia sp. CSU_2_1]